MTTATPAPGAAGATAAAPGGATPADALVIFEKYKGAIEEIERLTGELRVCQVEHAHCRTLRDDEHRSAIVSYGRCPKCEGSDIVYGVMFGRSFNSCNTCKTAWSES